jgi:flagellar biogenesis protein FliO
LYETCDPGDPTARQQKPSKLDESEVDGMFLILALVLVLAWIGGFVVFHTAGFFIHILLIFAVISIIMHFVRGSSASV